MKARDLLQLLLGRRGANVRGGDYVSTRRHIILGGCGRSGTTLARVILDSHPGICCGPESKVFLPGALDLARLQNRFNLDAARLGEAHAASRSRAEFIGRFAALCCEVTGKARWRDSLLAVKPYLPDRRVHTLRYESLVGEPRATIEKLLEFLQ